MTTTEQTSTVKFEISERLSLILRRDCETKEAYEKKTESARNGILSLKDLTAIL